MNGSQVGTPSAGRLQIMKNIQRFMLLKVTQRKQKPVKKLSENMVSNKSM